MTSSPISTPGQRHWRGYGRTRGVIAMSWGSFDEGENKAVPRGKSYNPEHEVRSGDLLLSRSNTVELVGAVVLVDQCRPKLLLSDKSMRLRSSPLLNKKWLQFALA